MKANLLSQKVTQISNNPPCSTFKAAIAVVGFATGKLTGAQTPEWPYREDYNASRDVVKQSHNPTLWMTNSCVWYTQRLVEEIGIEELKKGLSSFGYSTNGDFTAYTKGNNGLSSSFWISSSLKISPLEQLSFIEKLSTLTLRAPEKAQQLAQEILYLEEISPGWKFYGKTGAGSLNDMKYGWFVGWVTDGHTIMTAVRYLEASGPDYPSPEAKKQVREKFSELINGSSVSLAPENTK